MNKKRIMLIVGAIVLILVIVFIILNVNSSKDVKKLTESAEKLGKNFFEDYYYPSQKQTQKDVKEYMDKLSKNGIKIDLNNLFKVSSLNQELLTEIKKLAEDFKCDLNKSKISIMPKEPYEAKDYDINVELDCEKISK